MALSEKNHKSPFFNFHTPIQCYKLHMVVVFDDPYPFIDHCFPLKNCGALTQPKCANLLKKIVPLQKKSQNIKFFFNQIMLHKTFSTI